MHLIGMDIYSTLLWFMKKEGSLSSVALDLVELDRLSAQVSIKIEYFNILQLYVNI